MENKMNYRVLVFASIFIFAQAAQSAPLTPEMVLPAGVDSSISTNPYTGESGPARKGTVAATLNNIARLNQLLVQEETAEVKNEILQISEAIDQLIPSLHVIGLFDLFEPIYWIGSGEQPGRLLTLSLYFKHYPEKCTLTLKAKLLKVKDEIPSLYLQEALVHNLNS